MADLKVKVSKLAAPYIKYREALTKCILSYTA